MLRVTQVWSGTVTGLPYFSTWYTGGTTQSDANAAVAAVNDFWDDIKTLITTKLSVTTNNDVEVVDVLSGQVTGIFATSGGTTAGTAAGDNLSPATQGLVRWRTGVFVAGREIRGRTFIPGPVEGSNIDGAPVVGYTTLVNTAATGLVAALVGLGSLITYSPTHSQAAVIQTANTWNKWAVMRSRRD